MIIFFNDFRKDKKNVYSFPRLYLYARANGRTGECAYKDAFWVVVVFLLHFLCDVYVSIFFNNEKVSKKYFKPFQAFKSFRRHDLCAGS